MFSEFYLKYYVEKANSLRQKYQTNFKSSHLIFLVVTLDGSVPIKYGLLLNADDNYKKLKKQLAILCGLTPVQLLMAELIGACIKVQKIIDIVFVMIICLLVKL